MDFEQYLYDRVVPIIREWDEEGIYAISFYVYSNEAYTLGELENLSEFLISYNTEDDCDHAPPLSEERWNFAFWRQNTAPIIIPIEEDEGMRALLDWYRQLGIENVGYEDHSLDYDASMRYIGKGPIGYYELLCAVSNVARRIQTEGWIEAQFGKPIPIIVHDLEYPWYVVEATKNANPNDEADVFLESLIARSIY